MSLREQLKKAAALASKPVELSNGSVIATELSAQDRMVVLDYLHQVIQLQNEGKAKSNHYAILTLTVVCAGLRDENGKLEYNVADPDDRTELLSLGDMNIRKIHEAVCELSGLDYLVKGNEKKTTG